MDVKASLKGKSKCLAYSRLWIGSSTLLGRTSLASSTTNLEHHQFRAEVYYTWTYRTFWPTVLGQARVPNTTCSPSSIGRDPFKRSRWHRVLTKEWLFKEKPPTFIRDKWGMFDYADFVTGADQETPDWLV